MYDGLLAIFVVVYYHLCGILCIELQPHEEVSGCFWWYLKRRGRTLQVIEEGKSLQTFQKEMKEKLRRQ